MGKRSIHYTVFLLSGTLAASLGVILDQQEFDPESQILLNIGATIISVVCVTYLWEKSGGEPVRESLEILKRTSRLVSDGIETGLRRLYPSRQHIEYDELNERISKAREVQIMSLVLKVQQSANLKSSIMRCIKGGGNIRILVSDPISSSRNDLNPLKLRQHAQNDLEHQAIPAEIKTTLDYFRKIEAELSEEAADIGQRLQVKLLSRYVMYFSLTAIDDIMVVTSYCNKHRGHDCPTMLVDKTSNSRSLYDHFKEEFEYLWRRGVSLNEAQEEAEAAETAARDGTGVAGG